MTITLPKESRKSEDKGFWERPFKQNAKKTSKTEKQLKSRLYLKHQLLKNSKSPKGVSNQTNHLLLIQYTLVSPFKISTLSLYFRGVLFNNPPPSS